MSLVSSTFKNNNAQDTNGYIATQPGDMVIVAAKYNSTSFTGFSGGTLIGSTTMSLSGADQGNVHTYVILATGTQVTITQRNSGANWGVYQSLVVLRAKTD